MMLTKLKEIWSQDKGKPIHDFADKLNSEITVHILILMSTLVTYKTYFLSPIECFTSTSISGLYLENYITRYCWSSGTNYIGPNESMPIAKEWDKHRIINYYPWIPIILFIQCLLFYVPKSIWQEYCANKAGTDLQNIINSSITAGKVPMTERNEAIKEIALLIEALFHLHRDNRHGLVSDVKRRLSQKHPLLIWGKRSGNSILGTYMGMKLLCIINAVGQWFLMIRVLQVNGSVSRIFADVFNYVINGYNYEESIYFPRVTYCKVDIRSLGTMRNTHIAQCVLPINIFNEKIYILLFMWILVLIVMTPIYFLKWIHLICFRRPKRKFVKVYLKAKSNFKKMEEPLIDKFIMEFLRLDGIFLLKMIKLHAGELVTSFIVEQLWCIYKNKYRNVDLSNADRSVQFENLTFRLEPGQHKASITKNEMPSAPKDEAFL